MVVEIPEYRQSRYCARTSRCLEPRQRSSITEASPPKIRRVCPMFKFIVQYTCIVYLSALVASAESVTVRSGNGSILGRDSSISFLIGPASTDFASPFTPMDFANAQNGLGAYILLPN